MKDYLYPASPEQVLNAFREGQTVKFRYIPNPEDPWEVILPGDLMTADLLDRKFEYKILKAPEPEFWSKPEHVPVGCYLRSGEGHWFWVIYADSMGVSINNTGYPRELTWEALRTENWQYSTSLKTWGPCHVLK